MKEISLWLIECTSKLIFHEICFFFFNLRFFFIILQLVQLSALLTFSLAPVVALLWDWDFVIPLFGDVRVILLIGVLVMTDIGLPPMAVSTEFNSPIVASVITLCISTIASICLLCIIIKFTNIHKFIEIKCI